MSVFVRYHTVGKDDHWWIIVTVDGELYTQACFSTEEERDLALADIKRMMLELGAKDVKEN